MSTPGDTPPIARLVDISVNFENPHGHGVNRVLADVSAEIRAGELVVMVGRSGCGKTTALNLLAGLLAPTAGSVEVFGAPTALGNQRIGYMFARDALLPWRTAVRNVEFGLEQQGVKRSERERVAREYLAMVHLEGAEDRYPGMLSQGMRQRVALARTWARSADLLLMDEPFAALDAQTRIAIQEEFLRLWQEDRRTIVFVTHDLNEAIGLADRILVFANRGIAEEHTVPFERPRDLIKLARDDAFQALYHKLRTLLAEDESVVQKERVGNG